MSGGMTLKVYSQILAWFLVLLTERGCREEISVLVYRYNSYCRALGFLGSHLEREKLCTFREIHTPLPCGTSNAFHLIDWLTQAISLNSQKRHYKYTMELWKWVSVMHVILNASKQGVIAEFFYLAKAKKREREKRSAYWLHSQKQRYSENRTGTNPTQ